MTGAPLVSVLVLTRNGMGTLPRVVGLVRSQAVTFPVEIVAVDSESEDGTREWLRSNTDRLIEIRQHEFNHGTTRNVGVDACRGRYVILLVQDAEPESANWLARLVQPLQSEEADSERSPARHRLAATYGRQAPHADASGVVRGYLARYAACGMNPRRQSIDDRSAFEALPPAERLAVCTFDNVCSCIRRDVWRQRPFRSAPIAEDLAWAKEILEEGYDIAYVPEAAVVHSHDRPASYELRRTYLVHQQLRLLFGLATVPSRAALVRSVALSVAAHARWTLGGPGHVPLKLAALPRALALAVTLPLGQYLGARSVDTGREYLRVRGV